MKGPPCQCRSRRVCANLDLARVDGMSTVLLGRGPRARAEGTAQTCAKRLELDHGSDDVVQGVVHPEGDGHIVADFLCALELALAVLAKVQDLGYFRDLLGNSPHAPVEAMAIVLDIDDGQEHFYGGVLRFVIYYLIHLFIQSRCSFKVLI